MRIFAILKFLNPRGSFASFADKFVYRGIAAGRACLVSVRSSSIPGIFSRSWSFPFFEQLPDRGGSKRFESETETYEKEKKEGTNYVLVKKKKNGKYRLKWGNISRPFFPPLREKTLVRKFSTSWKRYDWKFSFGVPFRRGRNICLIIVEYLKGRETESNFWFSSWARIFFLLESTKFVSLISIEMERHSQLRWSKSWGE